MWWTESGIFKIEIRVGLQLEITCADTGRGPDHHSREEVKKLREQGVKMITFVDSETSRITAGVMLESK